MILYKGKLYDPKEQSHILENIENDINSTLLVKSLPIDTVITALYKLGNIISDGKFINDLSNLNIDGIEKHIETIVMSCKRENIEYKIKTELGDNYFETTITSPPFEQKSIAIRNMPLGTLLHIAAGNVDGLPVFSIVEGLLTGNVNILKLPQADSGLSIKIILKLIEIEPELTDFIYVFDTPSSDLFALKRMADISDGIVVWGGDNAVSAVRQFAPVGCRIIEWGHKLGFAYISGYQNKIAELSALASHIVSTKQLLCSSCQTIYLDTDNIDELHEFCSEFLPCLEKAALKYQTNSIDATAERTIRKYNQKLEDILADKKTKALKIYQGENCSLTICEDNTLELSDMFGNCLVKRLPQNEILTALRKSKGYLQTAGLICTYDKRDVLINLLTKSGLSRITHAGDMSAVFSGEAHDGEYPLRRYTRVVNVEI